MRIENKSAVVCPTTAAEARLRWLAFGAICLGVLMIVVNTTIVAVAIPSITSDLSLSASSLSWVLNAYTLPFGGFLLLAGRLGDLWGTRRLFLIGIAVFAIASFGSAASTSATGLISFRVAQGLGAALVTAVSLSLIAEVFVEERERAQAFAILGSVRGVAGGIGVLLGGLLTDVLNWHWIFFINVPVGVLVFACCHSALPRQARSRQVGTVDWWGGIAVSGALTLLVYAVASAGTAHGQSSGSVIALVAGLVLLIVFFVIESRAREPLIPIRIFLVRNFAVTTGVSFLWTIGAFAWFIASALLLQQVLSYRPTAVALAIIPSNVAMAVVSMAFCSRVIAVLGVRGTLCAGLALLAAGLALFARVPADATFVVDILPAMLLQGIGTGLTSTPLLVASMGSLDGKLSGLASGVTNTALLMGGALGVALVPYLTNDHGSLAPHAISSAGLLEGLRRVFVAAAYFSAAAAVLSLVLRAGPGGGGAKRASPGGIRS